MSIFGIYGKSQTSHKSQGVNNMDYDTRVMAILKKESGAKYFIREGGRVSSLLTEECLFSKEKAWAVSREFNEIYGTNDIIVFRTVGESTGFIGKTPEEILSYKKEALLIHCKKYKSIAKEKRENVQKKKKASAPIEPGGLFDYLGENRESVSESGKSRELRPYDIF